MCVGGAELTLIPHTADKASLELVTRHGDSIVFDIDRLFLSNLAEAAEDVGDQMEEAAYETAE